MRKRLIRQSVSLTQLFLGVVIVLGYSPSVVYTFPNVYIELGWSMIIAGLLMHKFWQGRAFSLLSIPLIINCFAILNYALDHQGAGLTTLTLCIASVIVIIVESQYSTYKENEV